MSDRTLSAFLLNGLLDVCESDGISSQDVLAASGTDLAHFDAPDVRILRSQAVAIIAALAKSSPEPGAAFRLGLACPIEASADLVRLFTEAPDLAALIAPLNALLGGVCGGEMILHVDSGYAQLSFGFPSWNLELEEPFQEAAAGILIAALRLRFGRRWRPIRVLVGHRRRKPIRLEGAGIEIVRGAPANALVLDVQDVHAPPRLDISNEGHAGAQVIVLPNQADLSQSDQVRLVVHGRLSLSMDTDLSDVAKVFGISARTLKRHLAADGDTVSSIVEDVKIVEAKRLLADSTLSVTEIALALNYSQPPSFTRAFKRSTGASPSEFRRTSGLD